MPDITIFWYGFFVLLLLCSDTKLQSLLLWFLCFDLIVLDYIAWIHAMFCSEITTLINCHSYRNLTLIVLFGCLYKIMYSNISPKGSLQLYEFIAMVTGVMVVLSQLPTFHSLRHLNLASLLLSLGYTSLIVGACIHAGRWHSLTYWCHL